MSNDKQVKFISAEVIVNDSCGDYCGTIRAADGAYDEPVFDSGEGQMTADELRQIAKRMDNMAKESET